MDLLAQSGPTFDGPTATELLDRPDRSVEGNPRHHLRVREVLPGPAYLPDALVGLTPAVLEEIEEHLHERPRLRSGGHADPLRLVQRVTELAVDVELVLERRGVADAHRP